MGFRIGVYLLDGQGDQVEHEMESGGSIIAIHRDWTLVPTYLEYRRIKIAD